jgi:hypothetical protein
MRSPDAYDWQASHLPKKSERVACGNGNPALNPGLDPLTADHRFRIVTADSACRQESVTIGRNRRSRCSGMTGHVRPEFAVTILRNRRSRCSGILGHVGPEYAQCRRPTTEQILRLFSFAERHTLLEAGRPVQVFNPELTPLQRQVLDLLRVPQSAYRPG